MKLRWLTKRQQRYLFLGDHLQEWNDQGKIITYELRLQHIGEAGSWSAIKNARFPPGIKFYSSL